jgi:hypothetical protein
MSCTIPILDGYFGSEIEIVATVEGLELGGYSILDWAWIVEAYRIVRPSGDHFPASNRDTCTLGDESASP